MFVHCTFLGFSSSGFALEAPFLPAPPMGLRPASSCMRSRPGWLRGGGSGERREKDKDRESTVGLWLPSPLRTMASHSVQECPWCSPSSSPAAWLPRAEVGLEGPWAPDPLHPALRGQPFWGAFSPKNSTFHRIRQQPAGMGLPENIKMRRDNSCFCSGAPVRCQERMRSGLG